MPSSNVEELFGRPWFGAVSAVSICLKGRRALPTIYHQFHIYQPKRSSTGEPPTLSEVLLYDDGAFVFPVLSTLVFSAIVSPASLLIIRVALCRLAPISFSSLLRPHQSHEPLKQHFPHHRHVSKRQSLPADVSPGTVSRLIYTTTAGLLQVHPIPCVVLRSKVARFMRSRPHHTRPHTDQDPTTQVTIRCVDIPHTASRVNLTFSTMEFQRWPQPTQSLDWDFTAPYHQRRSADDIPRPTVRRLLHLQCEVSRQYGPPASQSIGQQFVAPLIEPQGIRSEVVPSPNLNAMVQPTYELAASSSWHPTTTNMNAVPFHIFPVSA